MTMGPPSQLQAEPNNDPARASSHFGILSARMVLAVLVSPWFGVGFVYGLSLLFAASGWQYVIMLSLMALGPAAISLSLSLSLRGVVAALIASFALIFGSFPILELVAPLLQDLFPFLEAFPLGPSWPTAAAATIPIIIALPITGYVRRREEYVGLLVGSSVGILLTLILGLVAPWLIEVPMQVPLLDPLNLVAWGAPFAFVWSSSIFFPELFRRWVGWAGLLIWAGLQAAIFALGPLLNPLATA